MAPRSVRFVLPAQRTFEGAGFLVHRAFPNRALDMMDPFLMLDEMGPMPVGPGEAKGAPDHPHRGFETVTYMLSGEMEHEDSAGHRGKLGPGDVQWMTAGSGVIHSEEPSASFREKGGLMHGFQLWVNLPAKDKRAPPRYQELPAAQVPVARSEDKLAWARVIAGEALGVKARIETRSPMLYVHFILDPGASVTQPLATDAQAFVYVIDGTAALGPDARSVTDKHMAGLTPEGDSILLANRTERPVSFLLIAGVPLDEPVARYGPFVMNTEDEIAEAIRDYQSGRFAPIKRS